MACHMDRYQLQFVLSMLDHRCYSLINPLTRTIIDKQLNLKGGLCLPFVIWNWEN